MQTLRDELLTKARNYYERLQEQGDDPTIQVELAGAYFRLGQIAVHAEVIRRLAPP